MNIKLFADGSNLDEMTALNQNPDIKGFTTNPTLMQKAGVKDYESFGKMILNVIIDKPVSFEVFSDNLKEIEYQAKRIASWGKNVYVKIPITNTQDQSTLDLVHSLSLEGVKVNVTAVLTKQQIRETSKALNTGTSSYLSVFAGRIADTGIDPIPTMKLALSVLSPHTELIWASCRELFNIVQADALGCHIITVPLDMLKKLSLMGQDLKSLSLDTVKMFHKDAQSIKWR